MLDELLVEDENREPKKGIDGIEVRSTRLCRFVGMRPARMVVVLVWLPRIANVRNTVLKEGSRIGYMLWAR
jgi:hypothetical protein